jgi:uncharacterized protein YcbX
MWTLLDSKGAVMTQKQYPMMVKIVPQLDIDCRVLALHFDGVSCKEDGWQDHITVPLIDILPIEVSDGMCIRVCGTRRDAKECGSPALDQWLTRALGVSCRLAAVSDISLAESFKNEQPFLVVAQESIDAVSKVFLLIQKIYSAVLIYFFSVIEYGN